MLIYCLTHALLAKSFQRAIFKQLCSSVSNKLDTAKNRQISTLLLDPLSSKLWRQLRSLGTLKEPLPSALSHFSMTSLNAHFSSVTNWHPPLNPTDLPYTLKILIPDSNITPFSFTPVTDAQVLSEMNSSYTNSAGPDFIQIHSKNLFPHNPFTSHGSYYFLLF